MANFAKINNENIVEQVIVISNDVCGEPSLGFPDTCAAGRAFIANTLKLDGVWKQTSFSGNFRHTYAGIGYTYDPIADVFINPQPFPSWSLNENYDWQAPTPKPDDGTGYVWDEANLVWQPVTYTFPPTPEVNDETV